MTTVEWFVSQLKAKKWEDWNDIIEQALEMEKEQIIDAYERGWDMGALDIDCNSEKYYCETYKKDNQ